MARTNVHQEQGEPSFAKPIANDDPLVMMEQSTKEKEGESSN